jgi:hypothetical protein
MTGCQGSWWIRCSTGRRSEILHCRNDRRIGVCLVGDLSSAISVRQRSVAGISEFQSNLAIGALKGSAPAVDAAITGDLRGTRGYAVWGGSRCVGVFFARWGVIFAGDGMPRTPRGPSSSCWISSSVLRGRPSSSWRGGPNTSIVAPSLSRLSGWQENPKNDNDFARNFRTSRNS